MSRSISFTPRHAQPFTLDQAMILEVDMLVVEISRLDNSIAHLRKTQEELVGYLREDPEEDNDGELGKAIEENDQVIASQTERITLIKVALLNKVGEGGVRHMGLSLDKVENTDTRQNGDIAGMGRPPGDGRTGGDVARGLGESNQGGSCLSTTDEEGVFL